MKELYPLIPPSEACARLRRCLQKFNVWESFVKDLGVESDQFLNDLEGCVAGSTVEFDGKWFQQVNGLPIGSVISGLLANFYLFEVQESLGENLAACKEDFLRYVHDFLILVSVETDSLAMLDLCNSLDENLFYSQRRSKPTSILTI